MKNAVYKLEFLSGVHFGKGFWNDSTYTFHADALFSALYMEAMKMGSAEEFYSVVDSGKLTFSDAFPYMKNQYFIPKPMIHIESVNQGNSEEKKLLKKMKFLPIEILEDYLAGQLSVKEDYLNGFGSFHQEIKASVRKEGETVPFYVGTFYYNAGNGLYIIASYENEEHRMLLEELLDALSYTGIGGKKTSGLGKFQVKMGKLPLVMESYLSRTSDRYMTLSGALPIDEELESALVGASYQLERRSGFVASDTYAEEYRKKRDMYVFSAGSCFLHRFKGGIYDVSSSGSHPVYRLAIPFFMGV